MTQIYKVSFSQVTLDKIQRKTIKNEHRTNAFNIVNNIRNHQQQNEILKVVDNIQRKMNANELTYTVIEKQAQSLKEAGVNSDKIYELLNHIIVMSRHNTTSETKTNWFGMTYNTATTRCFIKDIKKSSSVLEQINSQTNFNDTIDKIALTLISAAIAQATNEVNTLLTNFIALTDEACQQLKTTYTTDYTYILEVLNSNTNTPAQADLGKLKEKLEKITVDLNKFNNLANIPSSDTSDRHNIQHNRGTPSSPQVSTFTSASNANTRTSNTATTSANDENSTLAAVKSNLSLEQSLLKVEETLQLYDISEELACIYKHITADMITEIAKDSVNDTSDTTKKSLIIHSDSTISIVERAEKTKINSSPDLKIFNITINKLPSSNALQIIITPSKKHSLLKGETWDSKLRTFGIDKKLKTSLRINYSNPTVAKVDLCMKYSKRSNQTELRGKYIDFKGIALQNKAARKKFIENNREDLDAKIKHYYDTTIERKINDPKPDNVLYDTTKQEITHIDINAVARTELMIPNILEFFREDYPQAVHMVITQKGTCQADKEVSQYSPTLEIIDSLNLEQYEQETGTEMITFIDINGTVLRYRNQDFSFGNNENADKIVLVNEPFNITKIESNYPEEEDYNREEGYNSCYSCTEASHKPYLDKGQIVMDTFATELLKNKAEILSSYKNEGGNKFSPGEHKSARLAPYVFSVFHEEDNIRYAASTYSENHGETVAIEMALQLYNEAKEYYPNAGIKTPDWLVDKLNNLFVAYN